MKFRKKPVVVEAIQYDPSDHRNCEALEDFLEWDRGFGCTPEIHDDGDVAWGLQTLEGEMLAMPGDWIIRGVAGEYYPCKPDIFEATYEKVDEE